MHARVPSTRKAANVRTYDNVPPDPDWPPARRSPPNGGESESSTMNPQVPGAPPLAVPLRLPPGDWENVLDALGAAAERTSADIECVTCTTTAPCARHDGDWTRVDRWRALASQLRDQLTATPE
jgi:hypothetical protein